MQADLTRFILVLEAAHSATAAQIDQAVVARTLSDAEQLASQRKYSHVVLYGDQADTISNDLSVEPQLCTMAELETYATLYPFLMTDHPHYIPGRVYREYER